MSDRTLRLCLVSLVAAVSTGVVQGAEAVLKVGAAQVEITPAMGFPMAGYYHERLATGKKDPLWAKAVVWEQGEVKAAFVGCDLTGISFDLTSEVRQRVAAQTGIPPQAIIL